MAAAFTTADAEKAANELGGFFRTDQCAIAVSVRGLANRQNGQAIRTRSYITPRPRLHANISNHDRPI
jgi:hypothetical protein